MATVSLKKKLLFLILCLASVTQGMYSTYFVSILTTIERIYQIKSKTAGAILSATEIGQIIGSPMIAYYGGRGNKPKWIAACMTLTALAALAATTPHFMLTSRTVQLHPKDSLISPSTTPHLETTNVHEKNIATTPLPISVQLLLKQEQLCQLDLSDNTKPLKDGQHQLSSVGSAFSHRRYGQKNSNLQTEREQHQPDTSERPVGTGLMLFIFFTSLLVIGFGSTAVTTLGIPFIDDIVTKEESPLYLGLTIGLRIFGPALGFLLGSLCIGLNSSTILGTQSNHTNRLPPNESYVSVPSEPRKDHLTNLGDTDNAWWLGLVLISIPLICLAVPMYHLSFIIVSRSRRGRGKKNSSDFEGITYQAAEDHDIGGSSDLQPHMLTTTAAVNLGLNAGAQLDVVSGRTSCSSEMRSLSHENLKEASRGKHHQQVIASPDLHFTSSDMLTSNGALNCKSILDNNFGRNVTLDRTILTSDSIMGKVGFELSYERISNNQRINGDRDSTNRKLASGLHSSTACIIVDNSTDEDGRLLQQSTSFTSDKAICGNLSQQQQQLSISSPASSTISSSAAVVTAAAPPTTTTSSLSARSTCSHDVSSFDLSSTISRLIKNKLLLLRMLSGVLHILPIAGFYTFLPKYLIEQYQLTSSSASAISGLAGILFVGLGTFLGGTVVRVWNVNSKMMTKWIAASSLFYALGMLILMNLGCKQAHQTIYYDSLAEQLATTTMGTSEQTIMGYETNVSTTAMLCFSRCKCSSSVYNPVCANGTTFMSPCLAGCKSYVVTHNRVIYEECGGCGQIDARLPTTQQQRQQQQQQAPNDHVNLNVALQGHCPLICDNLKWYIIAFSVFTLIHASSEAGSMMFNLRCVDQSDRTLALGLITLTSSLFGRCLID